MSQEENGSFTGEAEGFEFTLGSSRRVHLRHVADELNELWRTAGEEARSRGQGVVTRLREANLLVFASGAEMADRVGGVIARAAQSHPARAIVLLDASLEDRSEDVQEAWVTAACYRTKGGGRHVCWEQVTIPARGRVTRYLHAAAMSLLVPDLPTAFWWPGQPDFMSQTFQRLSEVSDLVVLDSAGFEDPVGSILAVKEQVENESRNFGVDDLNWTRLTPWRSITAEMFDEPDRRAWLGRIGKLTVRYACEDTYERTERTYGPATARALLYASWLASRLEWTADKSNWESAEEGGWRTTLRAGESAPVPELELELVPVDGDEASPGGLVGVWIEVEAMPGTSGEDSEVGSSAASITLERPREGCMCSARIREGAHAIHAKTLDVSPAPEEKLLSDSLDFLGPDRVYEEALLFAAELVSLDGGEGLRGQG